MPRPQDRVPRRKTDPADVDFRNTRRTKDTNGELEITTPLGSGKLSAGNFLSTLTSLGLLAAISVIGYFIWDSQVKGFEAINQAIQLQTGIVAQYSADLKSQRVEMSKEHESIGRAFSDVAYIISLPQDTRGRLGLEEPPGLRRRLRGE